MSSRHRPERAASRQCETRAAVAMAARPWRRPLRQIARNLSATTSSALLGLRRHTSSTGTPPPRRAVIPGVLDRAADGVQIGDAVAHQPRSSNMSEVFSSQSRRGRPTRHPGAAPARHCARPMSHQTWWTSMATPRFGAAAVSHAASAPRMVKRQVRLLPNIGLSGPGGPPGPFCGGADSRLLARPGDACAGRRSLTASCWETGPRNGSAALSRRG